MEKREIEQALEALRGDMREEAAAALHATHTSFVIAISLLIDHLQANAAIDGHRYLAQLQGIAQGPDLSPPVTALLTLLAQKIENDLP